MQTRSALQHSDTPRSILGVSSTHGPRTVSATYAAVAQNVPMIITHHADANAERITSVFEKSGAGLYTKVAISASTYKVELLNSTQTKVTKLGAGTIDSLKINILL